MDAISAQHIVKKYARQVALDDVTINIPQQKIFGLLGPNGAGKTSFIRIINQITAPDEGAISFFGEPLKPEHVAYIGYLPEERGLYKKMKVAEQCIYLAQLKGMPRAQAVRELKHWFQKFDMTAWWDKKVEELSKGMAQKVQFITTVLHKPKMLILDEPFSGFDPINTNLVKSEILRMREEGTSVILSTHNMASVEEICDHIALINKARVILEGEVKEVRQQFKEHTFEIGFKGQMLAFTHSLWTQFELLEHSTSEGITLAKVRFVQPGSLNQLLEAIMPHVEITSVREIIPSMSEVFIKAVEGQKELQA